MAQVTQRVRKIYSPIDISCNISPRVGDGICPLTQDYDSVAGSYVIDRTTNPSVVVPVVSLFTDDGSINELLANRLIGNVKWLAMENKESSYTDISTNPVWQGKYEISQASDETKGTLTIRRNLSSTETVKLKFSAYYNDVRTGSNIYIESLPVTLATNLQAQSRYKNSLAEDNIVYDPIYDDYNRVISTNLFLGGAQVSDYTIKVYEIVQGSNVVYVNDERVTVNAKDFVLDLRFIDSIDLYIEFIRNNVVVSKAQFSADRKAIEFEYDIVGGTSVRQYDKTSNYRLDMFYNGEKLVNPEQYANIDWFTDSESKKNVPQGNGSTATIDVVFSGMGNISSSYMDVKVNVAERGISVLATDELNNEFTDELGNDLFI